MFLLLLGFSCLEMKPYATLNSIDIPPSKRISHGLYNVSILIQLKIGSLDFFISLLIPKFSVYLIFFLTIGNILYAISFKNTLSFRMISPRFSQSWGITFTAMSIASLIPFMNFEKKIIILLLVYS